MVRAPVGAFLGMQLEVEATNCSLSSMTEHSFQGIHFLLKKGGSVTHVSGAKCHLCVRPRMGSSSLHFKKKAKNAARFQQQNQKIQVLHSASPPCCVLRTRRVTCVALIADDDSGILDQGREFNAKPSSSDVTPPQ